MRPIGSVRVEYVRDGRGVELARVELGAPSWWVSMAEGLVLLLVVRGEGTARCRGERIVLHEGLARLCMPHEVAVVETERTPIALALFQVPRALLRSAAERAERFEVSPTLAALASDVASRWQRDARDGIDDALTEMLALLPSARTIAAERPRRSVLEPGAVRRARLYLESRFRTTPTLDDLVAESGASKFHLARSFRAYHGVPPHTYLNYYRLAVARTLIASGARGSDAAVATGFADQSHFSRSFRKLIGVSPLAYARVGDTRTTGRGSSVRRVPDARSGDGGGPRASSEEGA
ncbi:Transcriptional regulator, AraC family protein [Sandaracinus amylolyticus]|uniref:Transcriptional regulator, AraC family protein n=1 Tax=Sandaracinus amylolyticus TaxID=927083 RepID=A0A0F6YIZ0_9BACT|nr:Transcriptional regulator, AraC family protein [Sandaracinus amylolyticus]